VTWEEGTWGLRSKLCIAAGASLVHVPRCMLRVIGKRGEEKPTTVCALSVGIIPQAPMEGCYDFAEAREHVIGFVTFRKKWVFSLSFS
jgi:hypothetical protein